MVLRQAKSLVIRLPNAGGGWPPMYIPVLHIRRDARSTYCARFSILMLIILASWANIDHDCDVKPTDTGPRDRRPIFPFIHRGLARASDSNTTARW